MSSNNVDAELASIVTSLSALSTPSMSQQQGLSPNQNNINSNSAFSHANRQTLGGFRRSSFNSSDMDSDILSQNSASYLDSNAFNPNPFASNNQHTSYSVGTAPPYVSAYSTTNNNNNGNTGYYPNSGNQMNNQMKNRLNLLETYSNNLNMNNLNPNPLNSNNNNNNNINNNNNFSNSNLSYEKENNYYAHTIQNITTNNANTGFFEKFGKSLIEGTKELENDILPSSQLNFDNYSNNNNNANIKNHVYKSEGEDLSNSDHNSNGNESSNSSNINNFNKNQNVWNVSNTQSFQPQTMKQDGKDLSSPPFFFNQPILNNGFTYGTGGNFQQFSMGSPNNFIPQMFYPLNQQQNQHTSIPSQNDNNNNNKSSNFSPVNKNTNDSNIHNPNSSDSTVNNSNNNNNNPIMFVASPQTLNNQQQQDKNIPVNKHNNNNNNNNNNNSRGKSNKKFNPSENNNNININNAGNPYLDPHNTSTINTNFIDKLATSSLNNNNNSDVDDSTKKKPTTSLSQQNSAYHRSPLLEEIRNNMDSNYSLKDIVGYSLEFCKDQYGSRFIQKQLAIAEPSEKEVVFNELRDHILMLSNDVFGNYVIQKFFEHGSPTQRTILIENFRGKMKDLSVQMYACRVIQKALEYIQPEQRIDLVKELSGCVLKMIKDQNGNHVIQKAIECIPIELLPFVLTSLIGHIYHLSTHSYGCRVIQRLLEFGSLEDQTIILNELKDFIPYLLQDQYGNYVIQHILQHGSDDPNCLPMVNTKQEIINIVGDNVVEFSKHKFASNVVEKAILYGTTKQKDSIISKILPKNKEHAANLEDNAPMILMMRDQFANYVVQKLVTVSEGEGKILIVIAIRAYLDKLNRSNSLGNRHLASVEKLAALVDTVEI
ncbi:mRNA-binding protein Puf3p [Monosporozyma servazzii]